MLPWLEESLIEYSQETLDQPPPDLREEQLAIYRQIQIQRDPALVALQSPEQRDRENADVARRVQKLLAAPEKLYLLTFNPQRDKREEFHSRLWSSPLL